MKSKVSEWGNSHGLRITSAMMEHLNVQPGDEVELSLTSKGIEILKIKPSVDDLRTISENVLSAILERTNPVNIVEDPYLELDVAYMVVDINPCAPLIREVPAGTDGAFATLVDAKEAARKVLQASIAEAQKSLRELRQLGINNITYVSL